MIRAPRKLSQAKKNLKKRVEEIRKQREGGAGVSIELVTERSRLQSEREPEMSESKLTESRNKQNMLNTHTSKATSKVMGFELLECN